MRNGRPDTVLVHFETDLIVCSANERQAHLKDIDLDPGHKPKPSMKSLSHVKQRDLLQGPASVCVKSPFDRTTDALPPLSLNGSQQNQADGGQIRRKSAI
jgi:hypothetical protein